MSLISLSHVSKSYTDSSGSAVPVLRDISLSIEAGESVAIVGPSGCGKSTLLNLLGTLDEPDEGEIIFEGVSMKNAMPKRLAALRSEKIGFIFQLHHLLPQCSVLENVLLPTLALAARPNSKSTTERALELLKTVGLDHRANFKPAQLSGGEQQRAAFVRALINQPKMILADEPTGALDEINSKTLTDMLISLVEKYGIALVLVSHNPQQAQRMKRVLHLHEGRLQSDS